MFFAQKSTKEIKETNEIKKNNILYQPVKMTVPQKTTIIGLSFLGLLGISYLVDYVLCFIFISVSSGIIFYDNNKLVDFVNERKIFNKSVIEKINDYSNGLSFYLTPVQITTDIKNTVDLTTKNASFFYHLVPFWKSNDDDKKRID